MGVNSGIEPPIWDPADAAKESLEGSDFVLGILAGIVVGFVLGSAANYLTYILRPTGLGTWGVDGRPIDGWTITVGVAVYLSYLIGVVRQMHGLGIVLKDSEYQQIVGRHQTQKERIIVFASTIVLIFSIMFVVVLVNADPTGLLRKILDSMASPAGQLLALHLAAVGSYLVWDIVAMQEVDPLRGLGRAFGNLGIAARNLVASIWDRTRGRKVRREPFLCWEACEYREFVHNWANLAALAFSLGILSVIVTAWNPFNLSDRGTSIVRLWILAVLTGGYSVFDYFCNSHFYFRRFDLRMHKRLRTEARMKTRRKLAMITAGVALIITTSLAVVAGCGKGNEPPKPPEVTLQLKWIFNSGFAGDIVAEQDSLWQNLKVKVAPGGMGIDPIKAVTSGKAQFGVATGDQLLLAIQEGAPVIALALVYQDNPLTWIVKTESGIQRPEDFRGKKVGLTFIELWSRVVYDRLGSDLLHAVDERHSLDHLGQEFVSIQPSPSLLRTAA